MSGGAVVAAGGPCPSDRVRRRELRLKRTRHGAGADCSRDDACDAGLRRTAAGPEAVGSEDGDSVDSDDLLRAARGELYERGPAAADDEGAPACVVELPRKKRRRER